MQIKNNKTDFIRNSWLNIFIQNGYHFLDPVSLVPKNDKSLFWVNSGVATIKQYFNNSNLLTFKNLVNCQPVIRTDDIDQINKYSYHQTLFEMLGNFSIGKNFKKEVIPIVWEWFTSKNWLNLNPEFFFITVWEEDKETYNEWINQKIPVSNIFLGSKKSNYWDLGDGPCGPNTELYYDQHKNKNLLPKKIEDLNSKRFIELANIVFPDLYHSGNKFLPLEKKCVDTGVGLERVSMVLQEKNNVFSIDLWESVIEVIKNSCINK